MTRPLNEQDERESQRLWHSTVAAIREQDHDTATDAKTQVEERQREEAADRAKSDIEWQPKLFRKVPTGSGGSEGEDGLDWILNANM